MFSFQDELDYIILCVYKKYAKFCNNLSFAFDNIIRLNVFKII